MGGCGAGAEDEEAGLVRQCFARMPAVGWEEGGFGREVCMLGYIDLEEMERERDGEFIRLVADLILVGLRVRAATSKSGLERRAGPVCHYALMPHIQCRPVITSLIRRIHCYPGSHHLRGSCFLRSNTDDRNSLSNWRLHTCSHSLTLSRPLTGP